MSAPILPDFATGLLDTHYSFGVGVKAKVASGAVGDSVGVKVGGGGSGIHVSV